VQKYASFGLLQFLNFFTYLYSRLPDGLLIPEKEIFRYTQRTDTHGSDDLFSYSLVTNSMVQDLIVTHLIIKIYIFIELEHFIK
jgi:hypothetical protein